MVKPSPLPCHIYDITIYQMFLYHIVFYRKSEHSEEDRNKIPKEEVEPEDKFISSDIKPDIDSMAVQIFTDLPEDNPFQLEDTAQDDLLIHGQELTIEDPQDEVVQTVDGECLKFIQLTI